MSNRLELLKKPQLKFRPKAVARKSKEDREKVVVKEEPRPPPTRGRGGTRGRGRGRGAAYVGTHIVSAGPLASGSVGMGGHTNLKTGLTADRTYVAGQTDMPFAKSNEDEGTKINMGKAYAFDESDTVLFPVRPEKDESPELESVKSETAELVDTEEQRTAQDHREILDLVGRLASVKTESPAYLLMHMPPLVPKKQDFAEAPKAETQEAPKAETPEARLAYALAAPQFAGGVGTLNVHSLGKLSVTLGGRRFDLAQGALAGFLQDVVVVDSHGPETELLDGEGVKIAGHIHRLGQVEAKLVATPAL